MKIFKNVVDLIGNTPLVGLNRLNKGCYAEIYLKLEYYNPSSSVKDRLAKAMIEDAENRGLISENTLIVEPSSGNTGIGLALVCAVKGYDLVITMPESMSIERRSLIQSLGAKIILTPSEKGMNGAIEKANEIVSLNSNSYMPMQFQNLSNVEMHVKTTAMEIWNDTNGEIDAIVTSIGTGGTLTGITKGIRELKPNFISIAVEPKSSAVLSGGIASPHKIQGIGAGFIPPIVDLKLFDEIITVTNEQAIDTSRRLMKEEGILCGISSGANVYAAVQVAQRKEFKNKKIVTIVCDTADRYLSTDLFKI